MVQNGKLNKYRYHFLDRVGVGKENLAYMTITEQQVLRDSVRDMVSIFPLALVEDDNDRT